MKLYHTQGIKNSRIDVADALRGIAVAGIILYHSVEHFNIGNPAEGVKFALSCDETVANIMAWLLSGKMYGIFAMLFGLSFFIQNDNQQQRGKNFSGRFLWRMCLLFVLGIINTAFYDGDILMSYAVYAIILIPLSYLPSVYSWILFGLLIIQPVEIYSALSGWHPNMRAMGEAYGAMSAAHHDGTFIDNALANLKYGQKATYLWCLYKGRHTQTIALFILGMLLGRRRLFYNEGNNLKIWGRILGVCLPLTVLGAIFKVSEIKSVGAILYPIFNFFLLMSIVSTVVIGWYKAPWFQKGLSSLRTFGKMSLTNYFLQSIIGSTLFCGFGFHLAKYLGITYSVLVGLTMVICQYFFCVLWFRKHDHGPLEALWKKLTWIKF